MARKFPNRLLPPEAHYVGEAIEAGGILLVHCPRCHQVFRTSAALIRRVKGPRYVLLDKRPLCRVARCGGRGFYLYAATPESPLVPVLSEPTPLWRPGPCPADFRPAAEGHDGDDPGGPGDGPGDGPGNGPGAGGSAAARTSPLDGPRWHGPGAALRRVK
ncbi:hypothetical protein B5C34_12965 [Pacificimonas flava]|uniref:Uncharacterized protein n=2 Tax=Pacificimonas TaxID=1960290 RepID=A0A219B7D8_9SPHN|nr:MULTISPECIES: hypothetical protein [Pacificimonas]MBZ6378420.1 hypothetical protein [Pacificimonas aurantium]OWV34277.1 hypothetical protein B5C34_12965 [Pacificimonas flava]